VELLAVLARAMPGEAMAMPLLLLEEEVTE
jgi:hypothetical protein